MTLAVQDAAATWSMHDARRVFDGLAAPELDDVAGVWDGRFVGLARLRRLTAAVAAVTPLRGWRGKRILRSGEVINLVGRRDATHESVRGVAARGTSVLDEKPALVVDYSAAPAPVRWARGELRWLTPGVEVLGLLVFPVGGHALGPLPFILTRADETRQAES